MHDTTNTGAASNVKVAINSFPWQDFARHLPDFWSFPDSAWQLESLGPLPPIPGYPGKWWNWQ